MRRHGVQTVEFFPILVGHELLEFKNYSFGVQTVETSHRGVSWGDMGVKMRRRHNVTSLLPFACGRFAQNYKKITFKIIEKLLPAAVQTS